jgi:hypothetical protein
LAKDAFERSFVVVQGVIYGKNKKWAAKKIVAKKRNR